MIEVAWLLFIVASIALIVTPGQDMILVMSRSIAQGSAAGVAGLIKKHAAGEVPAGKTIVITVTGHGLKDPQWALRTEDGSDVQPVKVSNDVVTVAAALGLEEK